MPTNPTRGMPASPQGLFRSDNGGVTWAAFSYINEDPQYIEWMGTVQDGTPDLSSFHHCRSARFSTSILQCPAAASTIGGRRQTFLPLIKDLRC
jgi:hypothetical protein